MYINKKNLIYKINLSYIIFFWLSSKEIQSFLLFFIFSFLPWWIRFWLFESSFLIHLVIPLVIVKILAHLSISSRNYILFQHWNVREFIALFILSVWVFQDHFFIMFINFNFFESFHAELKTWGVFVKGGFHVESIEMLFKSLFFDVFYLLHYVFLFFLFY